MTIPAGFLPELVERSSGWPAYLPDHLSATQLSMLERCPEQYRHRYVLGKKEPPSVSLVWGTTDGVAHGINFQQKIETGQDLPTAMMRDITASVLDDQVESHGGAGEIDWRDDKPGDVKDKAVALVAHYHETVSPAVQPTAVEEEIRLTIDGVPVPYIGYVDVSTATESLERKTASQSSKKIPPQYHVQALGYALARRLPVDMHISTRTLKPAVYTPATPDCDQLRLPFDDGTADRAERMIRARAAMLLALCDKFGPDAPWPDGAGTMAWHVAVCDLCGFRDNGCVYW
jgi:hypothetical protein